MATYPFWKLHGLGNDFVFFDAMEEELELSTAEVRHLCDRHTGIGGDGVIVVKPSPRSECAGYMHYINADGSLAQMCGNGVRCFAKFLVDHGYVNAESGSFVADTLAGPKPITFTVDAENKLATATVDMDAPILEATLIPVAPNAATSLTTHEGTCAIDAEAIVVQTIESPWGAFTFACVSMGNPHAVCFLDKETFTALPDECFTGAPRSLKTLRCCPCGFVLRGTRVLSREDQRRIRRGRRCTQHLDARIRTWLRRDSRLRHGCLRDPSCRASFGHDRTSC